MYCRGRQPEHLIVSFSSIKQRTGGERANVRTIIIKKTGGVLAVKELMCRSSVLPSGYFSFLVKVIRLQILWFGIDEWLYPGRGIVHINSKANT